MAIISVDGHARGSRTDYRQYFEEKYLSNYDEFVLSQEQRDLGPPGSVKPGLEPECQWDSQLRLQALENEGVVAEVLFPNGLPFATARSEHVERAPDPALERQERLVYNRWLADFCADTPGRRAGQALISFDNVEAAVADVYWAKEHGLGGISMPSLLPGGMAFFHPDLDPVWAAIRGGGAPDQPTRRCGCAGLRSAWIRRHHDVGY